MSPQYYPWNRSNVVGSDSSGGAGIEADLKTFTVHKCYGMTCITGLTAQNTLGVLDIYPVNDQKFIEKALDAVFNDVGVDAVKTGMLATKETVCVVARKLKEENVKFLVVDPVMVSTSGSRLIDGNAIESYIKFLMPLATVVTPNIGEAEEILDKLGYPTKLTSLEDVKAAAVKLQTMLKCKAVLVKGGHLGLDANLFASDVPEFIVDVLYDGTDFTTYKANYINSMATHGTGCTLSAAIASNLALNPDLPINKAVGDAIDYVQHAIKTAFPIGSGHGPVNHLFKIQSLPFVPGKFLDYLLCHPKIKSLWNEYTNHPFTQLLATGKLPMHSFQYFLRQDYVYLKHYARCHGLAAYKADDMKTIEEAGVVIKAIAHEQKTHISYCEKFGISVAQLEAEPEGLATYAYSRYLLDIGGREDWISLQVALSPCLFGYDQAARTILASPTTVHGSVLNPYWKWVEDYSGTEFREASKAGRRILEAHTANLSSDKIEKLVDIFATATKMECDFWNQALNN